MKTPKEIYSDALRGARNQLKIAKRDYETQPTLENERRVKAIRRRCSIYGELQREDSK
ncbi:hypothetical protein ACFC3A_12535 [Enterococcus thailandicus]|uniref:hypothetical protein n=1 Tax=Enterococcus thailandicus TaxID=417368 RepID=UPI0039A72B1A